MTGKQWMYILILANLAALGVAGCLFAFPAVLASFTLMLFGNTVVGMVAFVEFLQERRKAR